MVYVLLVVLTLTRCLCLLCHNCLGVDKKTSILDYVVKSLMDKGEYRVLDVTNDLEVMETAAKLSDKDLLRNIEGCEGNLKTLEKELAEVESKTFDDNSIVDHEALRLKAVEHLSSRIEQCAMALGELTKLKTVMGRKIKEVIEYFGEDVQTCDTLKVFGVLQQFRRAVAESKIVVERRERSAARNNTVSATF